MNYICRSKEDIDIIGVKYNIDIPNWLYVELKKNGPVAVYMRINEDIPNTFTWCKHNCDECHGNLTCICVNIKLLNPSVESRKEKINKILCLK